MTVGTTGIPQALPAPYRKLALQGEKATLTLVERGGALPQLYIVPAPGTDSTRFAQSLLAALGNSPRCVRAWESNLPERLSAWSFPPKHALHCRNASKKPLRNTSTTSYKAIPRSGK